MEDHYLQKGYLLIHFLLCFTFYNSSIDPNCDFNTPRVALGKIFYTPAGVEGLKHPGSGCGSLFEKLESTQGGNKLGSVLFDSIVADRKSRGSIESLLYLMHKGFILNSL